ncbi:MAG: hypothetical protein IPK26_16400 [Planctomycetes bacterium]|nr:hypothetical protein [Planctomycetota bacterium]
MRRKPGATATKDAGLIAVIVRLGRLVVPLLTPFGVDRRQFLILLATRARVDLRKNARAEREGRPRSLHTSLALTVVMNLLLGLVLGLVLAGSKDPQAGLFAVFTFTMLMAAATLMTDHASTLLETGESQVLGPLPVDDRTVLAARVCHTLLWLLLLIGPLAVGPLLFGIGEHGVWPFVPLFLLAMLSTSITCLTLAVATLVIALRVASPARVRNWLLGLQILASLVAVMGYQMLHWLQHLDATWLSSGTWWTWLLPPAHVAALVVTALDPGKAPIGHAVLAVLLPAVLLLVASRVAPRFQERLLAMSASDRDRHAAPRRRPLRDLLLRHRDAIAGYDFAAAMIARDRSFRMRAWPAIVTSWFFAAWIVWRSGRTDEQYELSLACTALYVIGLSTPQVLTLARFADDWQARWLFVASPLTNAANFVAGAQLALALRFVAPAALVTALLLLAFGGIHLWPDVIWSLLVVVEFALLTLQITEHRLLFCEKFDTAAVQGSFLRGLFYLLLAGLAGWLHSVLRAETGRFLYVLLGFAVFVALHAIAIATGMKQRPRIPVRFGGRDRDPTAPAG